MAEESGDKQAEALARIAEQLERIADRVRPGSQPAPPPALLDHDNFMRMLGFDPAKQRERAKFQEEIKHLRRTRLTATVAVVAALVSAAAAVASAIAAF